MATYRSSNRRISSRQTSEKKGEGCYVYTAISAFFVVLIFEQFWPEVIPFTLLEFWTLKAPLMEVLQVATPVFAWAAGASIFFSVTQRNNPKLNANAEIILPMGCLISTWAGVFEEIAFRWLIFYEQIIAYKFINWLIFGFAGFGIAEWWHLHISAPIANFFTLGALEPILFGSFGWAVGAAIITSNGKFRNGHAYQGPIGFINSWFLGMFFFYLMFQYGIVASIIVHFLYDLIIYVVKYADAAIERKLGWV